VTGLFRADLECAYFEFVENSSAALILEGRSAWTGASFLNGKCSANPLAVWQVEPLLKAAVSAAFGHFQGLFVVSEC